MGDSSERTNRASFIHSMGSWSHMKTRLVHAVWEVARLPNKLLPIQFAFRRVSSVNLPFTQKIA